MKNYKYYNGEKENPFNRKDFGKAFWWDVEFYAYEAGDKKEDGKLSRTMMDYIKEHHWEGACQSNTDMVTALNRATAMYLRGIWSQNYISLKSFTLAEAEKESVRF